MTEDQKQPPKKKEEALPERFLRRVLEGVGDVVDRKFGRTVDSRIGLTTAKLIERMKHSIDERVRNEGSRGRFAPHHLKMKLEWGTHSEAPIEIIKELEHEVLAAAIDHINDQRYNTLAPLHIETEVDIFTTGISVDPTFGEFEEELQKQDEAKRAARNGVTPKGELGIPDMPVTARVSLREGTRDLNLIFRPGGRRLNVGRAADCDIPLNEASVSKIHAALVMNSEGTLFVADTGSTNGTYINGRRIAYGEARQIEAGDVVGFGEVEVRFRKNI
jgi:hypothetical protein